MFVIQVMGYIFAIFSCALAPILLFAFKLDLTITAIVIASILGFELLSVVATMLTCIIITRKKIKLDKR